MTRSRTWKPKGIAASGKSALPASHKEIWNDKLAHEGKILCSIMLRMRPLPARVLQGLMQIRPKVREACLGTFAAESIAWLPSTEPGQKENVSTSNRAAEKLHWRSSGYWYKQCRRQDGLRKEQ